MGDWVVGIYGLWYLEVSREPRHVAEQIMKVADDNTSIDVNAVRRLQLKSYLFCGCASQLKNIADFAEYRRLFQMTIAECVIRLVINNRLCSKAKTYN